ncbi:MAG: ribonuclease HII [Deltaproteobacteria bacterium RIFCSPLOWO2_02_FULL_57_26]|nr:MAG: ribonuclease HII [Deltaproteobacteria bacterium RIFCSPLOWO2_02_FULL_57_26]
MKRALTWLSPEMVPPARPHGLLEEEAYARGFRCVAGLDEVGRGPLAGPVVAGAVVLPRGVSHPQINDSKLLSAKAREALVPWIKEKALAWGLGIVGPGEIDRMNILSASLLAMAQALRQMSPVPDYLLIDGNQKIPLEFLKPEEARQQATDRREASGNRQESLILAPSASSLTPFHPHASRLTPHAFPFQRAIKKGDRLSISIAAASILAKVARDEIMMDYDRRYPEYGFGQHKGYASSSHLAALSRYGPSPIHRRSFSPVREWLKVAFGGEAVSSQLKF